MTDQDLRHEMATLHHDRAALIILFSLMSPDGMSIAQLMLEHYPHTSRNIQVPMLDEMLTALKESPQHVDIDPRQKRHIKNQNFSEFVMSLGMTISAGALDGSGPNSIDDDAIRERMIRMAEDAFEERDSN